MPTLKQYRRQVLLMGDGALGRRESIASLTVTTAVVNALAMGTISPQKFTQQYLFRSDAANAADYVRYCSNYTSSSGTLTHAGTNYADTTATDEQIEILPFEPFMYNVAIQETIRRLRRRHRAIIPTQQAVKRYFIGNMSWVRQPGDVEKVCYSPNPVATDNRFFENWNGVNTSGVLTPDHWTLAGTSATMARSTTQNRRGTYSVAITRAGTNCTLSQSPGLLENGVSGDSLRGRSVLGVAVVWSAVASQVRVQVTDGVDTTSSSYHTGGSTWEELTVSHTVNAAATTLTVRVSVESDNTVCYADECYLVPDQSALDDQVRRDDWPENEIPYDFDQGAGTLQLYVPHFGRNGQVIVYSQRPYPGFDETRLIALSADSDTCDAPLIPVATGAIARLYEGLAHNETPDRTRYAELSELWRRRFETLALDHAYTRQGSQKDFGLPFPVVSYAPPARRR